MGQLTDTLRATMRDLAQSDARLYRGLQQELGDTKPASRKELEGLSVAALWSLCKARGIKGLSSTRESEVIDDSRLNGGVRAAPSRSLGCSSTIRCTRTSVMRTGSGDPWPDSLGG